MEDNEFEIILEDNDFVEQVETAEDIEQQDGNQQEEIETIDFVDTQEESTDHELFIEGWLETNMLVLPDGFDYKGKSVTEVMAAHADNLNSMLKQSFIDGLPDDMKEAYQLALEGKISNAKEYLNYQVDATKETVTITDESKAREYLKQYYKNLDEDDDEIEERLDKLEIDEKLVERASKVAAKQAETAKLQAKQKQQEYLDKEAKLKESRDAANQKNVEIMKNYIDSTKWDANHRKFVEQELTNGMTNTVDSIKKALSNPNTSPEFVSLINRLIAKDDNGNVTISKEMLRTYASQTTGKEVKSGWESKLTKTNLPKTSQGSSSKNLAGYEFEVI